MTLSELRLRLQQEERTLAAVEAQLEDLPADGDPAPYLAAIEGRKLVIDGLNRAIERRLSERGAE